MITNQFAPVLAVFAALLLGVAGCNAPAKETATKTTEVSGMTSEDKQVIEKEISALTKEFFQYVEKLDIERCMTFFENTPDFLAVNPDGTLGDYSALKKLNADGFSQMAALKVIPKKEAIRILSDSQVLYTFSVGQAATLKTGQKVTYNDVTGTMLFTKINGTWKATFYHESAAPPIVKK